MPNLQDPSADDKKNLKKLLDAHLSVLEHKLGRPPQMSELLSELADGVESAAANASTPPADANSNSASGDVNLADPSEPKILGYKVYYGMKLGKSPTGEQTRVPDPARPLYYESGDGRCYDAKQHDWCPERPDILDHLQSRPLMFDEQGHDIMSALLHGVMDDDDYQALEQADLLNEHHKKIYTLNKQLQSQMNGLEKSENELEAEESEGEEAVEASEPVESESEGSESTEEYTETTDDGNGGEETYTAPDGGGEEEFSDGQLINVVEELMRTALEKVDTQLAGLEDKIRSIVAAEVSRQLRGDQV